MPLSGVSARVALGETGFLGMRSWSIDVPIDVSEYGSTSTSKGLARIAGVKDWTGQVVGMGSVPVAKPGTAFNFHGSIDGENGVNGDAICSGVAIEIRQETGEPIGYTMSFEGNGDLTYGAEAGAADASVRGPESPISLIVKYKAIEVAVPGEASTLADVRSVDLSITKALQAYAGSTSGAIRKRIASNFDLECSVDFYVTDPAAIPTRGAMYELSIYTTSEHFWDIKFAVLVDISGMEVDRETGAIVSATLRFAFSAIAMVGAAPGTATLGSVKTPGAAPVTWWPDE